MKISRKWAGRMTLCNWQLLVKTEDLPGEKGSLFDKLKFSHKERVQDLGCFCRARMRPQQGTWPYAGPLRRKHLGSFSNTQPSGNLFCYFFWQRWVSSCRILSSLCTICIVLCFSFGAVREAPRTTPMLKSVAAELIFHRRKMCSYFPSSVSGSNWMWAGTCV